MSDLYDQTNPQAVEIDRLRRCLAEVEAQLKATIRGSRERARLLAHAEARLAEAEAEKDAWKAGAHKDVAYLERALETAERERNDLAARLAEVGVAAGAVADAAYTSEMFATVLVPSERIRALERALGRGG